VSSEAPHAWFRWDGNDLLLWVRAQPKSSRNGFAEVLEDAIKVRITAPPVDGKANQHLQAWLAKQFRVAKRDVHIETGESSRRKRIRIHEPKLIPSPICDRIQFTKTET
jgi:uncharacterized protein (TIGR00251 family)